MTEQLLTSKELADLTGRRQPARQRAWLVRYGWIHAVSADGRPVVARAYFERRMTGASSTPSPTDEPDFAAIPGRA